ncbi:hypothetical protein SUGI_0959960 [Cryptomeria japonica]|nr:hypothetical protein SUGI_0959960 [Cryptomeria japonica]
MVFEKTKYAVSACNSGNWDPLPQAKSEWQMVKPRRYPRAAMKGLPFSRNGDHGKQNTLHQEGSIMSSISNKFTHLQNLEEGFVKPVPQIKPYNNRNKGNLDNWRSGGNYAGPKIYVDEGKNPKTLPPPKLMKVKPNIFPVRVFIIVG